MPKQDSELNAMTVGLSSISGDVEVRPLRPDDPSRLGYPATLPIEIALKVAPIKDICATYGISREMWVSLCADPVFSADYAKAKELISEGMGFKLKAQLQADALLKKSWELIHDPMTPSNVRADLIKSTIKWAGHDSPAVSEMTGSGFSININFGEGKKGRDIITVPE
jgi:hypothetical protein